MEEVKRVSQGIYCNDPVIALTQPELSVIEVAAVKVWFTDRIVHYKARRIEIDADIPPGGTAYYVTITDPDQLGDIDGEAELHAVCAKDHDLCTRGCARRVKSNDAADCWARAWND